MTLFRFASNIEVPRFVGFLKPQDSVILSIFGHQKTGKSQSDSCDHGSETNTKDTTHDLKALIYLVQILHQDYTMLLSER